MDLNHPSPAPGLDSVATNQLEKMEVAMVSMVKCIHSLGKQAARKHEDEDDDHDDDSQSSLNQNNVLDFFQGCIKVNSVCVNPMSDNIGKDNDHPPERPPGSPCDADENDSEVHVPFDSHRYPDGQHVPMYMRPPSSQPRNRTHDRQHQKKKFSRSRSTKPNKLNLISPLPDFQLHSLHHLLKYDRVQSCADKSSAGSDHTSKHKHHSVCHLNPTSATRRCDTTIK